jgi:hypothetical protein
MVTCFPEDPDAEAAAEDEALVEPLVLAEVVALAELLELELPQPAASAADANREIARQA